MCPGLLRRLGHHLHLFDALAVGVLLSRGSRILRFNPALKHFLGYAPEVLNDQSLERLLAKEGASDLLAAVREGIADGGRYTADIRLSQLDGRSRWARLLVQKSGQNDQRILVWTFEDITAEREAEEALRRVTREIYGILNKVVMGIALLRHRRIDRCNSRMEELFGFGSGSGVDTSLVPLGRGLALCWCRCRCRPGGRSRSFS